MPGASRNTGKIENSLVYPHRIRLRGPWQWEPLERRGPGPLPGPLRVTMPCRLAEGGLAQFAGRVRLVRKFGYPGRIDSDEQVWLTFDGINGAASILLNGQLLGEKQSGVCAFEVTSRLRPHNHLEVVLEADDDRAGLWGEVALEVRRTAFLDEVRAFHRGSELRVEGVVAGSAEELLELYVMVDKRHVFYRIITAGEAFAIDLEEPGQTVRVELVSISTIWYAVEVPVDGSQDEG